MGLDQYLYAEFVAKSDSPLAKLVDKLMSDEARAELDRDDYLYVSGWSYGTMTPAALYTALVEKSGIACDSQSPHINVRKAEGGGYELAFTIGYWRKCNQIHAWFVENCQGGVDECQPSNPIHSEQLAELYQHCKSVLVTPEMAGAVLPTQGGFFFGSTEYDDYYIEDVKETAEKLEKIFSNEALHKPYITYRYQSSW